LIVRKKFMIDSRILNINYCQCKNEHVLLSPSPALTLLSSFEGLSTLTGLAMATPPD
jgi:hypothetical protein